MIKRWIIFAGLVVVLTLVLVIAVKFTLDGTSAPPWGPTIEGNGTIPVAEETRVGQQFTTPLAGIYRIDLMLTPIGSNKSGQIEFHLTSDPTAGEEIWSTTLSTDGMQERNWQVFEFPPLRDSKGQSYYFYIESAGSSEGNGIAVGYSPSAILRGASARSNDMEIDGQLQFRTHYTLRTRDRIDLLLSGMTEGRPYLWGSTTLYTVLSITYALALGLLLWKVTGSILKEQEDRS